MRKELVTNVGDLSKGDKLRPFPSNGTTSYLPEYVTNKKGEVIPTYYIYVGISNNSVTLRNNKGQLGSYRRELIENNDVFKVYEWSDWRSVPTDSNALYKTNRRRIWYKKGNIRVKTDCNVKGGDKFDLATGLKICMEKYEKKLNQTNQNFQKHMKESHKEEEIQLKNLIIIEEVEESLLKAPFYNQIAFCINSDYKVRSFMTDFINKYYDFDNMISQGRGCKSAYKGNGKKVFLAFDNLLCLIASNPHEKATYNSIFESLYEMFWYCFTYDIKYIAMPKIGCGKNGLNWDKVADTMIDAYEEALTEFFKVNTDRQDNDYTLHVTVYY